MKYLSSINYLEDGRSQMCMKYLSWIDYLEAYVIFDDLSSINDLRPQMRKDMSITTRFKLCSKILRVVANEEVVCV